MTYLDSSAIVKLVVREPESDALHGFLRGHALRASCGLARVEVPRAVASVGAAATARAHMILDELQLVHLDDALLDEAGRLQGVGLRSLDAIHLAAARELGAALDVIVTYDHRMAAAGTATGLKVTAPA